MARSEDITINLNLVSEDLIRTVETLRKESPKNMATISANTASQTEGFSLSELDYDELLKTYGDDPVLLTILLRMKDFFTGPTPTWYEIKGWDKSIGISTDPSEKYYTKWDTTSTVSDTYTIKYDSTGTANIVTADKGSKYSISME